MIGIRLILIRHGGDQLLPTLRTPGRRCFSSSAEKPAVTKRPTRTTDRRCAGQSPLAPRDVPATAARHLPLLPSPALPYCALFLGKYVVSRRKSAARDHLHAHRTPRSSRLRSTLRFRRVEPSFPLQLSVLVGHSASAESPGDDTRRVEGLRTSERARTPRTPCRPHARLR